MSGGRWDYRAQEFEELSEKNRDVWLLMAALERELDWGCSGDTCRECACNRVLEGLQEFFSGRTSAALAISRDRRQNLCAECIKRKATA